MHCLANLSELQAALDQTHLYIDKIHLQNESGAQWERLVAMIHTLDHLQRLHERCDEEEDRAITVRENSQFMRERSLMIDAISKMIQLIKDDPKITGAMKARTKLYKQIKPYRREVMIRIARGDIDVPEGTDYLEGVRWLQRVNWHIVRITYHFEEALLAAGK